MLEQGEKLLIVHCRLFEKDTGRFCRRGAGL